MHESARHRWQFLTRGVSLKAALLAFVPVVAWIAFLFLLASAYRAVVHVHGPARVLDIVRVLVEIVTGAVAFKYFFGVLQRGAKDHLSVGPSDRP